MKDEALKLALEALEFIPESGSMLGAHAEEKRINAIAAIKRTLAAPVQEPVAIKWDAVHEKLCDVWRHDLSADEGLDEIQDLIATPPAAQPVIIQNYLEKDNSQLAQTLVGKWTGKEIEWTENPYKFKQGQNVYTTPPAAQRTWVGLTDEQRRVCVQSPFTEENYRAIEVKLKENNS